MAGTRITTVDTDGNKGVLAKGEFGYDDYALGTDVGRVWIGDGVANKALAFLEELSGYLPVTTNISVGMNANILTITDIQGVATDIDLSVYLDDTNLARLTGGVLDAATGIATFTRDDTSTFTLDLSSLLDTTISVLDNLTSISATDALSANMGKSLQDQITALNAVTEW